MIVTMYVLFRTLSVKLGISARLSRSLYLATPLAPLLGFTVPPPVYFGFLVIATFSCLTLVEVVKRRVARRLRPLRRFSGDCFVF